MGWGFDGEVRKNLGYGMRALRADAG